MQPIAVRQVRPPESLKLKAESGRPDCESIKFELFPPKRIFIIMAYFNDCLVKFGRANFALRWVELIFAVLGCLL
jgi:hypothetical protein